MNCVDLYNVNGQFVSRTETDTICANLNAKIDTQTVLEVYSETIDGCEILYTRNPNLFNFPVYIPDYLEDDITPVKMNNVPVTKTVFENSKYLRKCIMRKIYELGDAELIGPNAQNKFTPESIVKQMVSEFSPTEFNFNQFHVLFNYEFLEELIFGRNVNRKHIKFFTDNAIKAKYVSAMYDVCSYIIDIDEYLNQGTNMPRTNNLTVLGNPPYNEGSNGKDSKPMYNRFIETIIDSLKPSKLCMIVPSRWMVGGKGLDSFRRRMMNDTKISSIKDFVSSKEIFPDVDIAFGVNYFVWDSTHNGPCNFNGKLRYLNEHDVVIRDDKMLTILEKVKCCSNVFMDASISVSNPYGIRTSEPSVSQGGVVCYFNQSIGYKNVSSTSVKNNRNDITKWKLIVPIAPIAGQTNFNNAISFFNKNNIIILPPNEICSETYIVIKSFNTKDECENLISYIKTKFFRFLLLMRVDGQNVSRDCYKFIPDPQNYTHIYSDAELYSQYNLTPEEIEYIETKIKTLD